MAERTLRILNKILDTIIAIVLILAVLYSVYSLWDNYQLYQGIHDLQVKLKAEREEISIKDLCSSGRKIDRFLYF